MNNTKDPKVSIQTLDSQKEPQPPPRPLGESEPLAFIALDCYYYVAGEKVTGELLLNLPRDIPPAKLVFTSKGYEQVIVIDPGSRSTSHQQASSEIYALNNTVGEWTHGLEAGQYVYPFTFKLPHFAPATFFYSGDDSKGNLVKAQICYEMGLKLEVPSKPELNLSHSREFGVRNKYTRGKPSPSIELTEHISGCCWRNLGGTRFKLSVAGDAHSQVDQELKYKLEPDNSQCSAPINHVTGQVQMQVQFALNSGTISLTKTLSRISRPTWISANTSLVFEKDFEYSTELKFGSEEMNPSSNHSPLIKVMYTVEVFVYYDIRCKREPTSIRLPLHVDPKTRRVREEPALPRPWEPLESKILVFQLNC